MNAQNLALIVNLLTQINVFIPEAAAVAGRVIGLIKADHPEMSNADLIALLKGHAEANMARVDMWMAEHPKEG
jgi:hypothetical protein